MNYKLLVVAGLLPLAVLLSSSAWDVAVGMRAKSTSANPQPEPGPPTSAEDLQQLQETAKYLESLQVSIVKKEPVDAAVAVPEKVATVSSGWQQYFQAQQLLADYSKVELQLRGNSQPDIELLKKVRDDLNVLNTSLPNPGLPDQERLGTLVDSRLEQLAGIIKNKEEENARLARLQRAKELFARGLFFEKMTIYEDKAGYSSTDDTAFRGCVDELTTYLRELEQLNVPPPQEVVDLKRSAEFHEAAVENYRKFKAKDHQLTGSAQTIKASDRLTAISTADPAAEIALLRKFVKSDYPAPPRSSDLNLHKLLEGSLEALQFWQRVREILLSPPTEPTAWVNGLQKLQNDFPSAAKDREQHLRYITGIWVREQLASKNCIPIRYKYVQYVKAKGGTVSEGYFSRKTGEAYRFYDDEQAATEDTNTHIGYFYVKEITQAPRIPLPVECIETFNREVGELSKNVYSKSAWISCADSWEKMQTDILEYEKNGGNIQVAAPGKSRVSFATEAKFARQMVEQWTEISKFLRQ